MDNNEPADVAQEAEEVSHVMELLEEEKLEMAPSPDVLADVVALARGYARILEAIGADGFHVGESNAPRHGRTWLLNDHARDGWFLGEDGEVYERAGLWGRHFSCPTPMVPRLLGPLLGLGAAGLVMGLGVFLSDSDSMVLAGAFGFMSPIAALGIVSCLGWFSARLDEYLKGRRGARVRAELSLVPVGNSELEAAGTGSAHRVRRLAENRQKRIAAIRERRSALRTATKSVDRLLRGEGGRGGLGQAGTAPSQ